MAYEGAQFIANLAVAAGNDPALMQELRQTFHESVHRQVDLLHRSRCDGNWTFAALRLKGIAASFGADRLMDLSEEALDSARGDPVILRKLTRFCDQMTEDSHAA